MLRVVTSRPESMSVAHWEWLNSLDFGCIIFANPRPGQKSMPERIAKGDLDGDLYLVCWDEQVLSFIQAEPLVDEPSEDDDAAAHAIMSQLEEDPEWFRNAQNVMIDARLVNDMSRLTGKCYKLAESIADAACNKRLMLRHPDAMALMQAYTDALEFKKHGGKIMLPLHLHDKILPRHLQQYLTATPTTTL
jgi:RNA dependent RNA polymerase